MRTQGVPAQSFLFSTILIYTLLAGTAAAQPAALVRDINQQLHPGRDSSPSRFTEVGGIVFFVASDAAHGSELWRTDGTPGGTFLVKDIRPGPEASAPGEMTAFGDVLIFSATDGNRGVEVWRSDGTATGTVLVADVETGPGDSVPSGFTELAGSLYFVAFDAAAGRELWKTDGTAAGTARIGDPGPQSTFAEDIFAADGGLTAAGGHLFFAAFDEEAGQELWTSDGTPAGTFRLADVDPGPGSSSPQLLTAVGDALFFRAGQENGWTDRELWKSDGTAVGTVRVADIRPGPEGSEVSSLVAFLGEAFFYADDGVHGMELWRSDGTVSGTVLVADIRPGPAPSAEFETVLNPAEETLYFRAEDGISGNELWASDGTAAGTVLVRDLVPGPGNSHPSHFAPLGETVLFAAFNGVDHSQLWRSDGTAAGTFLLLDVPQNVHSSPEELAAAGGWVFFNAFVSREVGIELWRSDGTVAGTVLIEDLNPSPGPAFRNFDPPHLAAAGGTLFLFADDGFTGREPWTSDGTAAGTTLLADIQPGEQESFGRSSESLALGETLFFTAGNRTLGTELWRSDGTPAGTLPVTSLAPAEGGFTMGELTALASTILFAANHGGLGTELWRTSGAPGVAGSQELVKDIRPGPFSSFPEHLTVAGGQVFFTATEDVAFRALWRSDGTPAGTSRVTTLSPREMAVLGTALYFVAGDFTADALWKLEPAAGAVPVRVANLPGPVGSRANQLTTAGGILYFVADDEASGPELWRSNGTAAGTFRVADIRPGLAGSYPLNLTARAGDLFFTADDGASGRELWRVTGAASGAVRVADIYPGPESGQPQGLAVVAGTLLFAATDPVHGNELWASDGTPAGTRLLQDAVPGIRSSSPSSFTLEGDRVFFAAFHPETGRELWSLPLATLQEADPAGQLRDLIAAVRSFPLPTREGEDLVKRLEKALRVLEDGNPNNNRAAESALDGFVRKVEAQRGRRIPAATADAWITAAQAILQVITEGA